MILVRTWLGSCSTRERRAILAGAAVARHQHMGEEAERIGLERTAQRQQRAVDAGTAVLLA